jgi:hypothetical protein
MSFMTDSFMLSNGNGEAATFVTIPDTQELLRSECLSIADEITAGFHNP